MMKTPISPGKAQVIDQSAPFQGKDHLDVIRGFHPSFNPIVNFEANSQRESGAHRIAQQLQCFYDVAHAVFKRPAVFVFTRVPHRMKKLSVQEMLMGVGSIPSTPPWTARRLRPRKSGQFDADPRSMGRAIADPTSAAALGGHSVDSRRLIYKKGRSLDEQAGAKTAIPWRWPASARAL